MLKVKYPVIYVPVKIRNKLDKCCIASAGPNPNLTGMRRIWGENSFIVKSGVYLYKLTEQDYYFFRNI